MKKLFVILDSNGKEEKTIKISVFWEKPEFIQNPILKTWSVLDWWDTQDLERTYVKAWPQRILQKKFQGTWTSQSTFNRNMRKKTILNETQYKSTNSLKIIMTCTYSIYNMKCICLISLWNKRVLEVWGNRKLLEYPNQM